jgi:Zn-finger nucleic acid-binding protein
MNCPNCGTELRERDRAGIKIDFCPDCKGVWLDRGELDKIIERESSDRDWDDDDDGGRRERARPTTPGQYGQPQPPKKKKSFLSSLTEMVGGDD